MDCSRDLGYWRKNLDLRVTAVATVLFSFFVLTSTSPSKHVVFHNSIPSNLYVNAAHGPTQLIKDDKDGKTEIIRLLLYPTDKKSRSPKTARAVINSGSVFGLVTLRQDNPPLGPTFIAGILRGLGDGKHRFEIHEFGDIEDQCNAVGDVYNPYSSVTQLAFRKRPIGEVGSVMPDGGGSSKVAWSDSFVTLVGPRSVVGRAIVVTEEGGSDGGAERKRGCGVIGYAK